MSKINLKKQETKHTSRVTRIANDIHYLSAFLRNEIKLAKIDYRLSTVIDFFNDCLLSHPTKACLVSIDSNKQYSFKQINSYSNKVAKIFSHLVRNQVVGLLMLNCPEYVYIWLGLAKLGVITACLPTNLSSDDLLICLELTSSKVIVYAKEYSAIIDEIRLKTGAKWEFIEYESQLKRSIDKEKDEMYASRVRISPLDTLLYMFTSGTCGLPKAVIVTHSRFLNNTIELVQTSRIRRYDRVLVSTPIWHQVGGLLGVGSALVTGTTCLLASSFDAHNYLSTCVKHSVSVILYTGEMLRYLLGTSVSSLDRYHFIRLAIGQGLRRYLVNLFTKRFSIKCIEYYTSSEANCSIINLDLARKAACGVVPFYSTKLNTHSFNLIRVDETITPIRDSNGFCIRCQPGEIGLAIGTLDNPSNYTGYANQKELSRKKLISNVFKRNQLAFNFGDLMVGDRQGNIYFVDRAQYTFKTKQGLLISTVEIEDLLSKMLNGIEVVAYGVKIPNNNKDTKECMVTIINKQINQNDVLNEIISSSKIPIYAKPKFIRFCHFVEHTQTFKVIKLRLIHEGYNLNRIDSNDDVYYLNINNNKYEKLTPNVFNYILNEELKF